jgi:hypothetical protein
LVGAYSPKSKETCHSTSTSRITSRTSPAPKDAACAFVYQL